MRAKKSLFLQSIIDVLEQSADMQMITDSSGVILYVNKVFQSVSGFSKKQVIGKTPEILQSGFHPPFFYVSMWETLLSGNAFKGIMVNRKRTGEIFKAETTISPIRDAAGNTTHYFSTSRDVTESIQEIERLHSLANYDGLTGLPNRNLFLDRLQQSLMHAERWRKKVALVYLDIDNFKTINDTYGHAAGDQLLQEVASRIRSCVRQEDTVSRLGGDEFALILPDVCGQKSIMNVLGKIIARFSKNFEIMGFSLPASASIGVSTFPHNGDEMGKLLHYADVAMYQSKAAGGNGFHFYNRKMLAGADQDKGWSQLLSSQQYIQPNKHLELHSRPGRKNMMHPLMPA